MTLEARSGGGSPWFALDEGRFQRSRRKNRSAAIALTVAIASGTLETHVQHRWLHDALMFDVHSPFRNGVMVAVPMRQIALKVDESA